MGDFSWLTADTRESIAIAGTDHPKHPTRTVHLLQPGGEPPITEDSYDGDGVFGGVNAYDWLALHNLPPHLVAPGTPLDAMRAMRASGRPMRQIDGHELRTIGISLDVGDYLEDPATGRRMTVFHEGPSIIDPGIEHLGITWDQPVPGYGGRDPNSLVKTGVLVRRSMEPAVPLKFSFDPTARWEDLPASETCPWQGIHYEDDDGEDD